MCGKWPWLTPNWMGRMQVDPMESEIRMKNDGEAPKLESDLVFIDGYRYLKLCPCSGGIQYMYMFFEVICVCVCFWHYIRISLHSIYEVCASDAKCAQGIYIYICTYNCLNSETTKSTSFEGVSNHLNQLTQTQLWGHNFWEYQLGKLKRIKIYGKWINIQKWSWWWNSGILGKDHPIGASFNTSPGCKKHRRDKRKPPVLGKSLILGYLSNFLTFLIDSPTSICSSNFATYPASLTSLPGWGKKIKLKQLTSFMPIPFPAKKGLEISMNH